MDLSGAEMCNKIPAGGIIPCRFLLYMNVGGKSPTFNSYELFRAAHSHTSIQYSLIKEFSSQKHSDSMYQKGCHPCHKTLPEYHGNGPFPPSSLRTEAMAATQGVYSRLNTSNVAAANGVSTVAMLLPNNTSRVATTLSLP